jgi:hypothetical protein
MELELRSIESNWVGSGREKLNIKKVLKTYTLKKVRSTIEGNYRSRKDEQNIQDRPRQAAEEMGDWTDSRGV